MFFPPRLAVRGSDTLRHDMRGGVGDGAAPGRCTELVGNDTELVALLRQTEHGQQKVLSMRAVDPAGAQDQVRDAGCLDRLFAGKLAAAIHIDRASRIGFDVGAIFRPIKDIIGAVMNHCST
ncbi:hypothetical protein D3C81_1347630 [compost metagenome]